MDTNKTPRSIRVHLCPFVAYYLLLAGCGPYSDFTLPVVRGGDPSLVFKFEAQPDPVLTREPFSDALNPSIVGRVNLYSVYDRQWHTALATSDDGLRWQ